MELREILRILRRNVVVIVVVLAVALGAAAGVSFLQTPTYQSTAKVFVSVDQASSVQDLNSGNTYTQAIVKSYADLVTTAIVLRPVIDNLSLQTTPTKLATRVSANVPSDSVVLEISVTDKSADNAAKIADGISEQLASVVSRISPSADGKSSSVQITRVDPAVVSDSPVSPRIGLNLALGALAGLAIALIFAFLREALDTRVRGPRELRLVTDRPLLGGIRFDAGIRDRPLVVQTEPHGPRAEAFRTIRTNLQFLALGTDCPAFVVTSALQGEGKSTSTVNLALTIADAGKRTLIIDADLRRPKVADYLGIEGSVGLTDVLVGNASIDDVVQQWNDTNLSVLPCGSVPPNPSELLQSEQLVTLLAELRGRYDTILFDAPPLLPVSDAAILSQHVDGAIVVCSVRSTHRAQLRTAIGSLEQVDAKVLGLMLTMLPEKGADAYGNRYGYGYGYSSTPAEA